ncbi:MAG: hypothetical protein P4M14_06725 [Gammaproteobacteria bacterium]|nr:hypothetical protein [Gammaproteobacteria bacterium]
MMSWTSRAKIQPAVAALDELQKIVTPDSFLAKRVERLSILRAILEVKQIMIYFDENAMSQQAVVDRELNEVFALVVKESGNPVSGSSKQEKVVEKKKRDEQFQQYGVVSKIPVPVVLIPADDGSFKPQVNPYLSDMVAELHKRLGVLLNELENIPSGEVRDRIKKCRKLVKTLEELPSLMSADLQQVASEAYEAKILQIRNKLASIVSLQQDSLSVVAESKESVMPDAIALATTEALLQTLETRAEADKKQIMDLNEAIRRLQADQMSQSGQGSLQQTKIDQLINTNSTLEGQVQLFADEKTGLEEKVRLLTGEKDDLEADLEKAIVGLREVDQVNKQNDALKQQLVNGRLALNNIKASLSQRSWLKSFGIGVAVLVGLGLMATGIGALAGVAILAGISTAVAGGVAGMGLALVGAGYGLNREEPQIKKDILILEGALREPEIVANAPPVVADEPIEAAALAHIVLPVNHARYNPARISPLEEQKEVHTVPLSDNSGKDGIRGRERGVYSRAFNMFKPVDAAAGLAHHDSADLLPSEEQKKVDASARAVAGSSAKL